LVNFFSSIFLGPNSGQAKKGFFVCVYQIYFSALGNRM